MASEGRSSQYCFVKWAGDKTVTLCNTSGEQPCGILQNQPKSGETAMVAHLGKSYLRCGGSVAYGAAVKTNHSGMAITAGSLEYVLAIATEHGALGRNVEAIVTPIPTRSR